MPTPQIELQQSIHRHPRLELRLTDEYLTSQLCHRSDQRVRFEERVANCNGCGLVMDRDANAAENIYQNGRRGVTRRPRDGSIVSRLRGVEQNENAEVARRLFLQGVIEGDNAKVKEMRKHSFNVAREAREAARARKAANQGQVAPANGRRGRGCGVRAAPQARGAAHQIANQPAAPV